MPNKLSVFVTLKLEFEASEQAKCIFNALIADNIKFPTGLKLNMYIKKNVIIIIIQSTSINTLANTLDELLCDINLAKEVTIL
jgi:tRNA threonylcarbamoyladenosine modification (KEOPS) complex  Pcc1 subunit